MNRIVTLRVRLASSPFFAIFPFLVLATMLPSQTAVAQLPEKVTLRSAAEGLFEIGVGTGLNAVKSDESLALLKREFGYMTPENCMKPQAVMPNSGAMKFAGTDRYFDFANKHGLKVVGHCLVWAKDDRTPPWFFKDGEKTASREVLMRRMERYIETMVGRYGDEVDHWDVVNEALADGQPVWRESGWRSAFGGSDFIVRAFEVAHAADPTATLIYNDYRCELPDKRPDLIKLMKFLKEKNAPVHAIGLQGHYELDNVPFKELDETLNEIRKFGFKVMVSEVDIDVVTRGKWWADGNIHREELKSFNPYKDGCPPEVLTRQAEQYGKLFALYAKHSDIIERVTFWGLDDGNNWLNFYPWDRENHCLLFDRELKRKPAYDSVVNALLEYKRTAKK